MSKKMMEEFPLENKLKCQQKIVDKITYDSQSPIVDYRSLLAATKVANNTISKVISSDTMILAKSLQSSLKTVADFMPNYSNMINSSATSITKVLKQYNEIYSSRLFTESIQHVLDIYKTSMQNVARSIADMPFSTLQESLKELNFTTIKINNDCTLKYKDQIYDSRTIEEEFQTEINEIEMNPNILRNTVETIKEKFWLIILIFNLIAFLPEIADTCEFYSDFATEIQILLSDKAQYCYVVKEKAYLRESSNSKAKIIFNIPYGEKLEIISDIPRWYKIKYVDEYNNEYVGWIPKISVE